MKVAKIKIKDMDLEKKFISLEIMFFDEKTLQEFIEECLEAYKKKEIEIEFDKNLDNLKKCISL
ncbi:TPA: hypothetical protein [Aquificae Conch Spring virus]|nr:TPA: hypothetical protein [Aquificae Conch Spring virus]